MPDQEDSNDPVVVPTEPRLGRPPKVPTAAAEPQEVDIRPRLGPGAKVRYRDRNADPKERPEARTGRKPHAPE